MDPDPRAWEPFDPDDPQQRPRLAEAAVVAVVPSPALRASAWASAAAGALARTWASEQGRILLADLDLEQPRLTAALDLESREGVSDAFLFGVSLGRIAQPVGPGLLAAPAGTAVADPEAVLASPRWETLVDGFTEAGATLALFVPADIPGRDAVLARADTVVVLALAGETDAFDLGEASDRVVAVFGPREEDGTGGTEDAGSGTGAGAPPAGPVGDPAEPAVEAHEVTDEVAGEVEWEEEPRPESDEIAAAPAPPEALTSPAEETPAGDATPAPPEESWVGAAPEPAQHPPEGVDSLSPADADGEGDSAAAPGAESSSEGRGVPVGPAATEAGGRSRTGVLALALLIVVAAVVAAALFGLVEIPGITPADADAGQARSGAAAPSLAEGASPGVGLSLRTPLS